MLNAHCDTVDVAGMAEPFSGAIRDGKVYGRAEDPDFRAGVRPFFIRDPFEVAPDAAIVQVVDRAVTTVRGKAPPHIGDTPWMDAALLQAAGVRP